MTSAPFSPETINALRQATPIYGTGGTKSGGTLSITFLEESDGKRMFNEIAALRSVNVPDTLREWFRRTDKLADELTRQQIAHPHGPFDMVRLRALADDAEELEVELRKYCDAPLKTARIASDG